MLEELELAINLRNENKLEESNKILFVLVNKNINDPDINYQYAWSCDLLGLEKEAVPYYEKAIELGLNKKDLKGAYLGLGSTLRTLGEYNKSKETFEKAIEIFPEDRAIKTFYAMTLYNLNKHSKAMELLLLNLVQTSSDKNITSYKKAIEFYSDKLDTIW